MKILHVIPSVSPAHGGPSRAIETIERALSAAGISVTTATTDDDGPRRRLATCSPRHVSNGVERIYSRKWLEFYKVSPGMLPWLWRHVREFDVVHIHALFSFPSVVAAIIARRRGVPYVVRPLGTLAIYGVTQRRPWLKRLSLAAVEKEILRSAAAVHFTTQAEWNDAKLLRIPLRGVVIPLGVEKGEVGDAQDLMRRFPQLQSRLVLLYLSRLDPKKNVEGLLRALAAMDERHRDAVLLIAGDGDATYVSSLVALAQSLGVGSRVIWLGHVKGAQKAAALAVAQVFVLPSYSENFGIAVGEAMLAGLPCVLGRGVGIAREIQGAGAGLAVDNDHRSIANALSGLLDDEPRRRELGRQARKFAEQRYSAEVMADSLVRLYRDVIASGGSGQIESLSSARP